MSITPEQRQELIRLLQAGEELSPEWARVLFPPEKREYELVYHGKEREEDIIADTLAVPLQPVRTFGGNGGDWRNMLIFGDNLQVMKTLLEMKRRGKLQNADGTDGIRLVYIDPPFASKGEFQGTDDQKAYQDKIAGAAFIEFTRRRLVLLRELLAASASVVVHLDDRKVHHLKLILDEVLGESNFRNGIVWRRSSAHNKTNMQFGPIHDTLLFYGIGRFPFHPGKRPFMRGYIESRFVKKDERGTYQTNYVTGPGLRTGDSGKEWGGFDPSANGRHWAIPQQIKDLCSRPLDGLSTQQQLDALYADGLIVLPKKRGGIPMYKQYMTDGVAYQDLWCYQSNTKGCLWDSHENVDEDVKWLEDDPEKTGYPTQKPEGLVARLISSLTDKGDLVLDAFAGSGTTLAAAEKLGRRWIGIDCGKLAIYTIQKRLLSLRREIGNKGPKLEARPFALYNAGLYDFSKLRELPWQDWRFFALQLFGCRDERHRIGGIEFDGYRQGQSVMVFNHMEAKHKGACITEETIQEIHEAAGTRVGSKVFIIAPALAFDFQQDYIDLDEVRYYALRIPYSMIHELHRREFTALKQPSDEMAVNDTVEAVGFDFIRTPELEYQTGTEKPHGQLFEVGFIRIVTFKSDAVVREPFQKKGNLETLSMVMLDFDYDDVHKVFDFDAVHYADTLKKNDWKVSFPVDRLGQKMMAVFLDIYGNEARVLIDAAEFAKAKPKKDSEKTK